MGTLDTMNENRRGRAAVLAIGTANPPHCFYRVDYPDFYFRVTKSHRLTSLKDKFRRIWIDMPAADHKLANLIGLKSSVQRFMLYQQGCFAAGTALHLAKDLAENNPGARVLAVCSEIMVGSFQPPSETHLDVLVGSALFSDGAAAVIVGANPNATINERPLFQIVLAKQAVIPDSEDVIIAKIREMSMAYYLSKKFPNVIADNIEQCLFETLGPSGVDDWNKLFYVVHPGGPAVLKRIAEKLGLGSERQA